MVCCRAVLSRLVHRTGRLILAARHARCRRRPPTGAHGHIPDAERQDCRGRCQPAKEHHHSPRMEERPGCVKSLRNVGLLHHSTRAQTVPPAFSAKSLHDGLNCQACLAASVFASGFPAPRSSKTSAKLDAHRCLDVDREWNSGASVPCVGSTAGQCGGLAESRADRGGGPAAPKSSVSNVAHRRRVHGQQIRLGSAAGSHPQPLAPAAFASASRTQHAFASLGAGPPQHELVFALVPVSLSVVAVFDISPPHSGEHSLLTRQG